MKLFFVVAFLCSGLARSSTGMAFAPTHPVACRQSQKAMRGRQQLTPSSTRTTSIIARTTVSSSSSVLGAFGKKNKNMDLSEIETRDMTRDEMKRLNAENERVMNQELVGMTVFSLIISLPLLYLAWVGLFADTAEIAMNN